MAHAKDNKELPQDNEKDCLKNEKEKKINQVYKIIISFNF